MTDAELGPQDRQTLETAHLMSKDLWTLRDIAKFLHVAPDEVRRLSGREGLPTPEFSGTKRRWRREDVIEFFKDR